MVPGNSVALLARLSEGIPSKGGEVEEGVSVRR